VKARPATIEDCEALGDGMKSVTAEGRWLATEPSAGRVRRLGSYTTQMTNASSEDGQRGGDRLGRRRYWNHAGGAIDGGVAA
jgi:hypothetical protein